MPYLGNVPSSFNVGTNNIDNGSVTTEKIADGAVVNADVNASAAIAGTKISPDFGSQNLLTTGTATAASLIPTSSTAPANGLFLPSANNVALSTNGQGRLFVDASGNVGVGGAPSAVTFGGLDVRSGGLGLVLGADSGAATRTDATTKLGRYLSPHHLNAEEPVAALIASNDSTESIVSIGGGTALANAATTVRFFTAANNTTTTGTERLRITSTGALNFVGAGTAGSTQAVSFNGSAPVNSLVIDSSGRLGVGTSSPGELLTVSNGSIRIEGSGAQEFVTFFNSSTGGRQWTLANAGAGNIHGVSAGTLYFRDSTAGANRVAIDSSGRVGIGTTSPGTNLNVVAAGAGTKGGEIIISNSSARQNGNFAQLGFAPNNDYSGTVTCAFIRGLDTGGSAGNPAALTFGVGSGGSPSERMRIDDSGRLLVGTLTSRGTNAPTMVQSRSASGISPGYTVITGNEENAGGLILAATVSNSVAIIVDPDNLRANTDLKFEIDGAERLRFNSGGSAGFFNAADTIWGASSTGAGTAQAIYVGSNGASGVYGGSVCYKVFTNGNVQNTNNSYTALSDIKLKENIVDANSQWGDIKALKVRNYNLKEGQTHKQIGLIAQEVEPISPGLVYESPDRDEDGNDLGTVTKSVNYSVLYMKAVKALQEAMERIEQLETEMAAVKAQLS